MAETNGSINRHGGEVTVARSGRSVPEDVVLQDYVMLDFVEDFVVSGEQRVSEPDLTAARTSR